MPDPYLSPGRIFHEGFRQKLPAFLINQVLIFVQTEHHFTFAAFLPKHDVIKIIPVSSAGIMDNPARLDLFGDIIRMVFSVSQPGEHPVGKFFRGQLFIAARTAKSHEQSVRMRVKFAAAAAFQLYDHPKIGKEFKSPLQLRPQRPLLSRSVRAHFPDRKICFGGLEQTLPILYLPLEKQFKPIHAVKSTLHAVPFPDPFICLRHRKAFFLDFILDASDDLREIGIGRFPVKPRQESAAENFRPHLLHGLLPVGAESICLFP